jgi:transcriptional regulator with GAF, ATPase, and Fis domain
VRLLRVLQEKTIERIGGTEAIPLDLRVLAATHRNLESMIREGAFREDLFFRLSVFPIPIPPSANGAWTFLRS